jgi:hypothetical protein
LPVRTNLNGRNGTKERKNPRPAKAFAALHSKVSRVSRGFIVMHGYVPVEYVCGYLSHGVFDIHVHQISPTVWNFDFIYGNKRPYLYLQRVSMNLINYYMFMRYSRSKFTIFEREDTAFRTKVFLIKACCLSSIILKWPCNGHSPKMKVLQFSKIAKMF